MRLCARQPGLVVGIMGAARRGVLQESTFDELRRVRVRAMAKRSVVGLNLPTSSTQQKQRSGWGGEKHACMDFGNSANRTAPTARCATYQCREHLVEADRNENLG